MFWKWLSIYQNFKKVIKIGTKKIVQVSNSLEKEESPNYNIEKLFLSMIVIDTRLTTYLFERLV